MTGGAGKLIVNMNKTGCYYYYFYMNNKNHYIGAFQMFMRNVGVLSRLAYTAWGRTRNYFYLFNFFLRKELILLSFLDVLSVVSCSLREWSASQQLTSSQT